MAAFCLLQILLAAAGGSVTALQSAESQAIGPSITFDHPDACFIENLLKIQLFDIALDTCRARRQLAIGNQSEAAANWSMLEMHSVAAKIAADPRIIDEPEIATKLLAANQIILDSNRESARFLWLKQKQLWSRWLVLRRMQVAYIAVPARKSIRDWSLTSIRECLSELESLQSEIQKTPARDNKSGIKSATTPDQWSELTNDVTLLQTDFLLLRALYYPPRSTERIGAASEMLSAIEKAELRIGINWAGRPSIDLAKYAAYIHLDRSKDALDGIKTLDKQLKTNIEGKPRQGNRWRLQIATLAAEACRNLGNVLESNQWLDSVGGWTVAPEIAIEHFANMIAVPTGQLATEAQLLRAIKVKEEIGARFGPYWQQRADAILLANNPTGTTEVSPTPASSVGSLKVELLRSEARQLLAANRTMEAIEKLGQAEISAANSGNESAALDMAINSAAVLFSIGRKDEAEEEFHRAAMTYSKQTKAPDAAIMSVVGFVKAIPFDASARRLSPEEEEAELKQHIYRGRLMAIVNTWPSSDQATQSLVKLDRLFLATNQIPELLSLWTKRLEQSLGETSSLKSGPLQKTEFDQALSRFALIAIATQDAWFDHSIYTSEAMKKIRPALELLKSKLLERASATDDLVLRSILGMIQDASRWPITNSIARGNSPYTQPMSSAVTLLSPFAFPISLVEWEELFNELDKSEWDDNTNLSLNWCVTELLFQRLLQNGVVKRMDQSEIAILRKCSNRLSGLETQTASSIGVLLASQLNRSTKLYRTAIQCWVGEEATGVAAVKSAIVAEPQVPWWTYRSARLFQTLVSQRPQALTQFRQLAHGFSPGSESWLDARARTAQTLRLMGEMDKAKELTDVVFAAYPGAAKEWQTRFGR